MYLQILILQTFLLAGLVNAGIAPRPYNPANIITQAELDEICRKECSFEICYLTDVRDCRRFIVCQRGPRNIYTGTLKHCALGTYWDGSFTCGNPKTVTCLLDYCQGREGMDYPHVDNCKTFWRCPGKGKSPEPKCCTNGTYFDSNTYKCMLDVNNTCTDDCPINEVPCKKGLPTDDYNDGNCKTYYNCEDTMSGPVCCPDGQGYDRKTYRCEPSTCADVCPNVCGLRPGSLPNTFMLGNMELNCSTGTLFDPSTCTCGVTVKDAPDSSCLLEFDTKFVAGGFQRSGTQKADIIPSKGAMEGQAYKNVPSHRFDGDLFYRVMYFQQVFPNLYVNMIYQPEDVAPGPGRLLFSNCIEQDLTPPSLELILRNGRIILRLMTDQLVNDTANPGQLTFDTAEVSVGYTPQVWNRYRVVYNGINVYVLNEVLDNPQLLPETATQPLQGAISVAAEGLDIGKCAVQKAGPSVEGYLGSIAQIQITKCLRQEWINSYNAVAERINRAVDTNPMGPAPA